MKAGRYYVSVLVKEAETKKPALNNFGIGIDLGLKDFAVCSHGRTYKNINKTNRIRKLEKRLKREQRKLSRKKVSKSYQKIRKEKLLERISKNKS